MLIEGSKVKGQFLYMFNFLFYFYSLAENSLDRLQHFYTFPHLSLGYHLSGVKCPQAVNKNEQEGFFFYKIQTLLKILLECFSNNSKSKMALEHFFNQNIYRLHKYFKS